MASGFVKRGKRATVARYRATRPSKTHADPRVSTGIASFDYLLDGGLPLGSLTMIEQDNTKAFARSMLKYFTAEAVASGHHLVSVHTDDEPEAFLKDLPLIVSQHRAFPTQPTTDPGPAAPAPALLLRFPCHSFLTTPPPAAAAGVRFANELDVRELDDAEEPTVGEAAGAGTGAPHDMKIAFRYQSLPKVQSLLGAGSKDKYCHTFDLGKPMAREDREAGFLHPIDAYPLLTLPDASTRFAALLSAIREAIPAESAPVGEERPVYRVLLHDFGSLVWQEAEAEAKRELALYQFLFALRGMAQELNLVVLLAVPANQAPSPSTLAAWRGFVDAAFALESFSGTPNEGDPSLSDYHGFFRVRKMMRGTALTYPALETFDLAFKLKRKAMLIEKLHLPPDLAEDVARPQDDGPGFVVHRAHRTGDMAEQEASLAAASIETGVELSEAPYGAQTKLSRHTNLSKRLQNSKPEGDDDDGSQHSSLSTVSSASTMLWEDDAEGLLNERQNFLRDMERDVVLTGYLKKLGDISKPLKEIENPGSARPDHAQVLLLANDAAWRVRYFELEDGMPERLVYYRDDTKRRQKGIIHLGPDARVEPITEDPRFKGPEYFKLVTVKRTYYFKSDHGKDDAQQWREKLSRQNLFEIARGYFCKRGNSRLHLWRQRQYCISASYSGGVLHTYVTKKEKGSKLPVEVTKNKYNLIGHCALLARETDAGEEWLQHDFPTSKKISDFTSARNRKAVNLTVENRGILYLVNNTASQGDEPPMEYVCGTIPQTEAFTSLARAADLSDLKRAIPLLFQGAVSGLFQALHDDFDGIYVHFSGIIHLIQSVFLKMDQVHAKFICLECKPGFHDLLNLLAEPMASHKSSSDLANWINIPDLAGRLADLARQLATLRDDPPVPGQTETVLLDDVQETVSLYLQEKLAPAALNLYYQSAAEPRTIFHGELDAVFNILLACVGDVNCAASLLAHGHYDVLRTLNTLQAAGSAKQHEGARKHLDLLKRIFNHAIASQEITNRRGLTEAQRNREERSRELIREHFQARAIVPLVEALVRIDHTGFDDKGAPTLSCPTLVHILDHYLGFVLELLKHSRNAIAVCLAPSNPLKLLVQQLHAKNADLPLSPIVVTRMTDILLQVLRHRDQATPEEQRQMDAIYTQDIMIPLMSLVYHCLESKTDAIIRACPHNGLLICCALCGYLPLARALCGPGLAELTNVIRLLRTDRKVSFMSTEDAKNALRLLPAVAAHADEDTAIADYLQDEILPALVALCCELPTQAFVGKAVDLISDVIRTLADLAELPAVAAMLCKDDDLRRLLLVCDGPCAADIKGADICLDFLHVLRSLALWIVPVPDLKACQGKRLNDPSRTALLDSPWIYLYLKTLIEPLPAEKHTSLSPQRHATLVSTCTALLLPALTILINCYEQGQSHRESMIGKANAQGARLKLMVICAALMSHHAVATSAARSTNHRLKLGELIDIFERRLDQIPVEDTKHFFFLLHGYTAHNVPTLTTQDDFITTHLAPMCARLCARAADALLHQDGESHAALLAPQRLGPFEFLTFILGNPVVARHICATFPREMTRILECYLDLKDPAPMIWIMEPLKVLAQHTIAADSTDDVIATLFAKSFVRVICQSLEKKRTSDPRVALQALYWCVHVPQAATELATDIHKMTFLNLVEDIDSTQNLSASARTEKSYWVILVLVQLMEHVGTAARPASRLWDGAVVDVPVDGTHDTVSGLSVGKTNAYKILDYLGLVSRTLMGATVRMLLRERGEDAEKTELEIDVCLLLFAIYRLISTSPTDRIAHNICETSDHVAEIINFIRRGTATQSDADTLNVKFWNRQLVDLDVLLNLLSEVYAAVATRSRDTMVSSAIFRTRPVPALLNILRRDFYHLPSLRLNALEILSELARNSAEHCESIFLNDGLPVLIDDLRSGKPEVQSRVASALAFVVDRNRDRLQTFIKLGGVKPLVRELNASSAGSRRALTLLLVNCLNSSEVIADMLVGLDGGPSLVVQLVGRLVEMGTAFSWQREEAQFQLITALALLKCSQHNELRNEFTPEILTKLKAFVPGEVTKEEYEKQARAESLVSMGRQWISGMVDDSNERTGQSNDIRQRAERCETSLNAEHNNKDVQAKMREQSGSYAARVVGASLRNDQLAERLTPEEYSLHMDAFRFYLLRTLADVEASFTIDIGPAVFKPDPRSRFTFKVMISHTWADNDMQLALKIRDYFEEHKIPYWLDKDHMPSSGNIYQGMAQALKECDVVLCLTSRAYENSANCQKELMRAMELKRHVFPCRAENVPLSDATGLMLAGDFYWDLFRPELFEQHMGQVVEAMNKKASSAAIAEPTPAPIVPSKASAQMTNLPSDLQELLQSLKLESYADTLIANGIDEVEILVSLPDEELQRLGFRVGHIMKLRRASPKA
ncbi:uncharacterized protein MONBRDRAFT_23968 [Monosiga brevicollis MX1]|uniref:Elongator complex protein 4 n=1 Tax=Monosiga brevicollis TaxID=81824 RepID=A9UUA9_MONBE|nr:uncharacterized protein MONBRDRAFT_23968 [Monosiga brevicollis MX1]EDQ90873.1 predicted protein [Monosiga brevicollis MX1]|eukprot:XP_001744170.1 hypothetical protein [Monosiga brevicollis MX1]